MVLLLLAACALRLDWDDLEWEPGSAEDVGTVCLVAGDESAVDEFFAHEPYDAQDFEPGEPITAVTGLCFADDCMRNKELTLEATGLELHNLATFEAVVPVDGLFCNAVCDMHRTTLALDPLDEGTHTVTFGEESVTLEVPGTDRVCLGEHPFGAERDLWP